MKALLSRIRQSEVQLHRLPFTILFLLLVAIHEAISARTSADGLRWPLISPPRWWQYFEQGATEAGWSALALAFPFMLGGAFLAIWRWRSTTASAWVLPLLLVPVVAWQAFLWLALFPSMRESQVEEAEREDEYYQFPDKVPVRRLLFGLPIPIVLLLIFVAADWMTAYGVFMFVAVPFFFGLWIGVVATYQPTRNAIEPTVISLLSVAGLAVGLLVLGLEGLVCMVMAAPLFLLLALLGAAIGYDRQTRVRRFGHLSALGVMLLSMPLLMGAEAHQQPGSSLFDVTTTLEIDAPPEIVWQNVVSFSDLSAPADWLFTTGLAYPIRARIEGEGVGAIRYCEFSTGPFVEPIEVWDPPRLLRFSVTSNPAPMQEWNPFYDHVHPPHLDGFLASERGQFLLEALPGGRTRLLGTTWYQHGLWPETYWRLWSDFIIHRIHLQVLEHIRNLSEAEVRGR